MTNLIHHPVCREYSGVMNKITLHKADTELLKDITKAYLKTRRIRKNRESKPKNSC